MAIASQPNRRRPRTLIAALRLEESTQAYYRFGRKGDFHDLCPIALVERLPNEYDSDDLNVNYAQTMSRHPSVKSPVDLAMRMPGGFAFRPIMRVAGGEYYFLIKWTSVDRQTVPLFEEYCRISGRRLGYYNRTSNVIDGLPHVDLKSCQLTWAVELVRRYPRPVDPDIDVLQVAKEMLRKRGSDQMVVWEQPYAPMENPARHLVRLRKSCVKKAHVIAADLCDYFGEASEPTPLVTRKIPVEGSLQVTTWTFSSHVLYLAVSQLERELPCYIVVGTILRTRRK